jgi:hypothetical protein
MFDFIHVLFEVEESVNRNSSAFGGRREGGQNDPLLSCHKPLRLQSILEASPKINQVRKKEEVNAEG